MSEFPLGVQPFQSPESASGIQPLWFLVTSENVLDADGKFLEKGRRGLCKVVGCPQSKECSMPWGNVERVQNDASKEVGRVSQRGPAATGGWWWRVVGQSTLTGTLTTSSRQSPNDLPVCRIPIVSNA